MNSERDKWSNQYWAAYKEIFVVQRLLTPEKTTQHQTVLQENEATDTQRWLKTKVTVYAALQKFSCLKKWISLMDVIWIILLKDLFNEHFQEQAAATALGI